MRTDAINHHLVIVKILYNSYNQTAALNYRSHMAKRIFHQKIDPPPTTELGRTPTCYYHKHPILSFCTLKRCTLPLCKDCLPIHKKQHIKNKEMQSEGIVDFEEAREDALSAFRERKEEIIAVCNNVVQVQQRFRKRVTDYKHKMVQTISAVLDQFYVQSLAKDGNIQLISEIEQRTQQIRNGSLKQMIKYHQDIYGAQHFRKLYKLYNGQYLNNIKLDFNHQQTLQSICKAGIQDNNKPINQCQPPSTDAKLQIKNKTDLLLEMKQVKQMRQKKQSQEKIVMNKIKTNQMFKINGRVNKDSISMKQQLAQPIAPIMKQDSMHQRKGGEGLRKQITPQDDESQIFTYNLLKSKEAQRQPMRQVEVEELQGKKPSQSQSNIYTHNFNRQSSDNLSHQGNNHSRSKSKKKGLSLVKSHKSLHSVIPIHTGDHYKGLKMAEVNREMESQNRKSNWRNFIKMGQEEKIKEPHLEYYEPSILNPIQMRDLIAKNKQQDQYKFEKQLKTNRSAQFLVPVSDRRPLQ